jgi:hypothetical protein
VLGGCAVFTQSSGEVPEHDAVAMPVAAEGSTATALEVALPPWQPQRLPGKRLTAYAPGSQQGRPCLQAKADRSASLWRRPVHVEPAALGRLDFSWWVTRIDEAATVTDVDRDDAAARVVLAFDGDHSRLSPRNRMMFELAQTLTGETPPYATLMYVWDAQAPVGTVIVNGRTDRVRKIVVESGRDRLRHWRHYERDVRADFRLAFGESPGPLIALAYMTDADNTAGRAEACYGPVVLR